MHHTQKRRASRGYSLIEIALALTVLGILLGSALTPLSLRFELEKARQVRQTMDVARNAVIGYAVVNRTVERNAVDQNDGNRHHIIPGGRPYLPCPDIDGDGSEDRQVLTVSANDVVPLDSAAIMTVSGVCEQQKGMLPWRTLGLQEQGDPWGRHLTYWVDPAFSTELLGFDETFRADTIDPRLSVAVQNRGLTNETRKYQNRQRRDETGAIICFDFFAANAIPNITGGCPSTPNGAPEQQLNVVGGILNTTPNTMTLGLRISREVSPYDKLGDENTSAGILDGAAFVIISHGKNGYGGINQSNNSNPTVRCIPMPEFGTLGSALPAGTNQGDRVNAYYRPLHPFLSPPFGCKAITNTDNAYAENIYVSGVVGGSAPIDTVQTNTTLLPDDIVVWVSPNLLFGELLKSGAFPIPKLPYLLEE